MSVIAFHRANRAIVQKWLKIRFLKLISNEANFLSSLFIFSAADQIYNLKLANPSLHNTRTAFIFTLLRRCPFNGHLKLCVKPKTKKILVHISCIEQMLQ